MTRSLSHRSPEPSEHPAAGRTAISLCLGCKPWSSGSCIREGDISGKSDAGLDVCCHGDTQKLPGVRGPDGSEGRLTTIESAAPGPACSCTCLQEWYLFVLRMAAERRVSRAGDLRAYRFPISPAVGRQNHLDSCRILRGFRAKAK